MTQSKDQTGCSTAELSVMSKSLENELICRTCDIQTWVTTYKWNETANAQLDARVHSCGIKNDDLRACR